jgi:hypothetical protein
MKKFVLTILLAALSFGAAAQTRETPLKNLQSAAKSFKNKKRYVINHDQTADQTNVFFHYAILKARKTIRTINSGWASAPDFPFPARIFPGARKITPSLSRPARLELSE